METPKPENGFPKNVVVLVTHGSYFVPLSVRGKLSREMRARDYRLLKNFSDHGVRCIIPDNIPKTRKVIADFSRAIGDPNRAKTDDDLFRIADFNGIPIWEEPLIGDEKEQLLREYYDEYHRTAAAAIGKAEAEHDRVLVFDIHDTGQVMMAPNPSHDRAREIPFPKICLGDKHGHSCDPEIMKYLAATLEKYLGIKSEINHPNAGGYVTTKYGQGDNDLLPRQERFRRNVIQIEFGRDLYLNEKNQEVDPAKAEQIKTGLTQVMKEVGGKLHLMDKSKDSCK